jgi:hypothetical protein
MPDPQGLDVHSVQVSMRNVTNSQGSGTMPVHVVSYRVGHHGPFERTFKPGQFSPEMVKQAIDTKVRELRQIANYYPPEQANG